MSPKQWIKSINFDILPTSVLYEFVWIDQAIFIVWGIFFIEFVEMNKYGSDTKNYYLRQIVLILWCFLTEPSIVSELRIG